MSYEIYYDKAFIKVGDRFVPMVNSGSNNTFEVTFKNREIAAKDWTVLNYKNRSKLLYSSSEIRDIAKDYERISQESGMCFKTRNTSFADGEFERWILAGIKSARTIEEYTSFGNRMYLLDYSDDVDNWPRYAFTTTDQFLQLIEQLKDRRLLCVQFANNRKVFRPKRNKIDHRQANQYFILKCVENDEIKYFCKMGRRTGQFFFTLQRDNRSIKPFACEAAARRYLNKYKDRLTGFAPQKISNM